MPAPMTHSVVATGLVQAFEGCVLKAYADQRGILTIGYGHTYNVTPNEVCTPEQATAWLNSDMMMADRAVNAAVSIVLNQNEFDACVSLAFNIGGGAFLHSTLVRLLNAHDIMGAADQFLVWDKTNGETNPGLLRRRQAERTLFLKPPTVTA